MSDASLSDASASSLLSSSAASESIVETVHRLLAEAKLSDLSAAQLRRLLDCLSPADVLALFQRALEHASVELLHKLLALGVLGQGDVTRRVLRAIVEEGDAELLEAFLSSQDVTALTQEDSAVEPTTQLLHLTVQQDNAAMVAALLKRRDDLGLDLDARDRDNGWTALHYAVEWDSVHVQTLLFHTGIDVNVRASDGMTPVHLAVQLGFFDSVRFLVESGRADVSLTDSHGATPLHTAAREGHTALVDYLLHRGAKLDARDADGRTPLHVAAFFDESAARFARGESDTQIAVVRALLAHGADIQARDAHGDTVLHSAQKGRFDVIVDELLAHERQHRGNPPAAA